MNTIVAISSALAKSAISIIRLSGDEALHIASKLLKKDALEKPHFIESIMKKAKC